MIEEEESDLSLYLSLSLNFTSINTGKWTFLISMSSLCQEVETYCRLRVTFKDEIGWFAVQVGWAVRRSEMQGEDQRLVYDKFIVQIALFSEKSGGIDHRNERRNLNPGEGDMMVHITMTE